ncbi:MAG TPA: Bax inhibitor-1/YccA family protein, partial [Chroococcales cyanobacterium]
HGVHLYSLTLWFGSQVQIATNESWHEELKMKSGNPALNEKTFTKSFISDAAGRMTMKGTVLKTGVLTALVAASAGYTWHLYAAAGASAVTVYMLGGIFGGLVAAIVTIVKPQWAMVTAPVYAVLEGLALGGISASFAQQYGPIPMQAVGLTFGTLLAMLFAYTSGLIRATEKFKLGVVAATGAVAVYYLIAMLLQTFGHMQVPMIWDTGWLGMGFSAFVVILAAFNLILDFDFIEGGVNRGAPKYMEWYGAFGLMVTLIWLYMEVLRMLSKARSR